MDMYIWSLTLTVSVFSAQNEGFGEESLFIVQEFDADRALHIKSDNAKQLLAADASEGQTQTFNREVGFAFRDLLYHKVIDFFVELDRMVSLILAVLEYELKLWVRLARLNRDNIGWLQKVELAKSFLEVMHSSKYLCRNWN